MRQSSNGRIGRGLTEFRNLERFSACLLALLCWACSAGPERREEPSGLPQIVSLNPCIDAILLEVADPSQVLAISQLSHDPRSSSIAPGIAKRFNAVSGTVEEVVALDPDLVLAGSFLAPSTRDALNNLNYQTETFDIANDLSDNHTQIRKLARLAGHARRGEALIDRIERALADNATPAGHRPIATVLWQPGEIVPGEATLVSHLMRRMGFASHSEALGMGQGDFLPLEVLLAHPPELLLIAGDARAQHHPALAGLTHTRIERLDPSLLYCAGPTIIRTVTRLAQIREAAR
ncbi:MAG: hypothetical protein A3J40_12530 [Erythrobacter sp. RIFCSPHIGHO2_12_FULL_63_10]|nr:MAG: hypothetical protein A3J40_12530 [Erythrobacter sp. RIFCSPHIGHO2_12_FULL_63_10]